MFHCYERSNLKDLSELGPVSRAMPGSADLACRNLSACFGFEAHIFFLNFYLSFAFQSCLGTMQYITLTHFIPYAFSKVIPAFLTINWSHEKKS